MEKYDKYFSQGISFFLKFLKMKDKDVLFYEAYIKNTISNRNFFVKIQGVSKRFISLMIVCFRKTDIISWFDNLTNSHSNELRF